MTLSAFLTMLHDVEMQARVRRSILLFIADMPYQGIIDQAYAHNVVISGGNINSRHL